MPSSPDDGSYEVYYTYDGEIVDVDHSQGGGGSGLVLVLVLMPLLGIIAGGVYVRRNPACMRAVMGKAARATPPSRRPADKKYAQCDEEMQRAVGDEGEAAAGAAKSTAKKKRKQKWMLSVELQGGEPYQLTLPMSSASSPMELKQAIAEACLANLGMEVTPEAWMEEEELDKMVVQILDARVRGCPGTPSACAIRTQLPHELTDPPHTTHCAGRAGDHDGHYGL